MRGGERVGVHSDSKGIRRTDTHPAEEADNAACIALRGHVRTITRIKMQKETDRLICSSSLKANKHTIKESQEVERRKAARTEKRQA